MAATMDWKQCEILKVLGTTANNGFATTELIHQFAELNRLRKENQELREEAKMLKGVIPF